MQKYYFIDLFCGAGGVTTGVEGARWGGVKCAEVIACINHDAVAIASHEVNHPGVLRIQGFGDDYKLMGSKTKQKWMLGNAVEVNQAKVLIEASYGGNVVESERVAA